MNNFDSINYRFIQEISPNPKKMAQNLLPVFPLRQDGKVGLMKMDGSGEWIVEPQFDAISYIPYPPTFITFKGNCYGLIGLDGKELLPCEMDGINPLFENGLMAFSKNKKIGLITSDFRIIAPEYDEVEYLGHFRGNLIVKKDGKWGYILYDELQFIRQEEYEQGKDSKYKGVKLIASYITDAEYIDEF